tara:strand:- start:1037 stop:1666 length:630 start_codon:yes stop_codon:yes gene_type:complete
MAVPDSYFLFRKNSRAVKTYLQDNTYLTRYPKDSNVLVMYATPARAYSRFLYPIENGQQERPVVSFHLSGYQYLPNENLLGHELEYNYQSSNTVTEIVKPLLIYGLTYSVVIRTVLQSDMDILIYQILTTSSKNKKHWTTVEGQWMEIGSTEPRDEINLEPGDAQDRIIRFGLDLVVPRAYLPRDYVESGAIESWQLEYDVLDAGDSIT